MLKHPSGQTMPPQRRKVPIRTVWRAKHWWHLLRHRQVLQRFCKRPAGSETRSGHPSSRTCSCRRPTLKRIPGCSVGPRPLGVGPSWKTTVNEKYCEEKAGKQVQRQWRTNKDRQLIVEASHPWSTFIRDFIQELRTYLHEANGPGEELPHNRNLCMWFLVKKRRWCPSKPAPQSQQPRQGSTVQCGRSPK